MGDVIRHKRDRFEFGGRRQSKDSRWDGCGDPGESCRQPGLGEGSGCPLGCGRRTLSSAGADCASLAQPHVPEALVILMSN